MSDKVFKPEEIVENPFPGGEESNTTPSNQTQSKDVVSSPTTKAKSFPKKIIAGETIAQSLNTKSKKILGEYEFTQQGAIKVGDYQNGVSGEVKISPNGLIARNMAGLTTFALDGDTGDATFAGRITGGSMNINNNFQIDSEGNVIANSIALASTLSGSVASNDQLVTSTTSIDVDDATKTFTLERETIVLILVDVRHYLQKDGGGAGAWQADASILVNIDGIDQTFTRMRFFGGEDAGGGDFGNTAMDTSSIHHLTTLGEGSHTIKLTSYVANVINTGALRIYNFNLSIVTLGSVL